VSVTWHPRFSPTRCSSQSRNCNTAARNVFGFSMEAVCPHPGTITSFAPRTPRRKSAPFLQRQQLAVPAPRPTGNIERK